MLNASLIADSLTGLVGWRPDPAGLVTLPTGLLTSRSGLFMQDASELLTLDVLRHIVPRPESLGPWLLRLQADALKRFVTALAAAQGLDGKVLLPETKLVKNPGNRADTVNKLGRFVGVQLQPFLKRGTAFTVPALTLQLDGTLPAGLSLYLYSDEQAAPLATVPVLAGNQPYFPFPVDLSALPTLPTGGRYWLGYYEDDLPVGVHAIQASVGPCGCTDDPFMQWSRYVAAVPFSVPATALQSDRTAFDAYMVSLESQNYGLNLRFTSYCDVVTALQSPDNQTRLAPVVQQAVAVRLYEAIVSTTNVTQLTGRRDVQADALAALYTGQAKLYGGKVPGTDAVYPSALKGLALDLSGLDAACGPPSTSLLSMGSLSTR